MADPLLPYHIRVSIASSAINLMWQWVLLRWNLGERRVVMEVMANELRMAFIVVVHCWCTISSSLSAGA